MLRFQLIKHIQNQYNRQIFPVEITVERNRIFYTTKNEFSIDNYSDKANLPYYLVKNGRLDILKQQEWCNFKLAYYAMNYGYFDIIKHLFHIYGEELSNPEQIISDAATYGNLLILQWLYKHVTSNKNKLNINISGAIERGYLDIVVWADMHTNINTNSLDTAITFGISDLVWYLKNIRHCTYTKSSVNVAKCKGYTEVISVLNE